MDCVQVAGLKVAIYSGRQGERMAVREARRGARARGRERVWGVGSRRWGLQRVGVLIIDAMDIQAATAKQVGRYWIDIGVGPNANFGSASCAVASAHHTSRSHISHHTLDYQHTFTLTMDETMSGKSVHLLRVCFATLPCRLKASELRIPHRHSWHMAYQLTTIHAQSLKPRHF